MEGHMQFNHKITLEQRIFYFAKFLLPYSTVN